MHESYSDYFTRSILPGVRQAALKQIGEGDEHEDDTADFIADAWEIYVLLARHLVQPELRHVLDALATRSRPKIHESQPQMLSLSCRGVRRRAEALPA